MRKVFASILLLWFAGISAQHFLMKGSPSYDVVRAIQQSRYALADSLLQNRSKYRKIEYNFLKTNLFWWMSVTSPNERQWRDSLYRYILRAEKIKPENGNYSEDYYIKLMNYGFRFRLAFKEDRFLEALKYSRKLTGEIQYALDSARTSPYLSFTAGIYLFAAGYGKRVYWYLYPYFLLIPEGNEKQGLIYLKHLSNGKNRLLATEADYILMRIYKDLYGDYARAETYAHRLVDNNPDNFFYRALLMQIEMKNHKDVTQEARQYLLDLEKRHFTSALRKQYFKDWMHIK